MKSFFCNTFLKNVKKSKVFSSHLKSYKGDLVNIVHHKFKKRLKELPKWTYLLFPSLIQAAIQNIFQRFLSKWMYTLQYHHFLAVDCSSGLHQLQSFYHIFLKPWLGLVPTGQFVAFFLFFLNTIPYIIQWLLFSRIHLRAHTMCVVYSVPINLSLNMVSIQRCWQITSI